MKVLSQIFYALGILLLIFWMFQMLKQEDVSSFQGMQDAMSKTKIWGYAGFACFWIPGIFYWIVTGMKINLKLLNGFFVESIFPSFSRIIPIWAQLIRVIGAGLLIYSSTQSIAVVDGELVFSFEYFWMMLIGCLLFFCVPFLFAKKDGS